MRIRAGGVSKQGRRQNNQDAFSVNEEAKVFAVADGMGGLEGGERVSREAVTAVRRQARGIHRLARKASSSGSAQDRRALFNRVEQLYEDAGGTIYDMAEKEGQKMGTTLTTAVLSGDQLTVGHVGDSRAYRIRGRTVDLLTTDHSVAAMRYRRGTMTLDEYYDSPLRNVLYEFLGHDPEVGTDVVEETLQAGDKLVLCSDGVWDYISNERLIALASIPDPQLGAEAFVDEALHLGSDDNCTAVVVHVVNVSQTMAISPARALAFSKLFSGMKPSDLRMLTPFMSLRATSPGDEIIREGDMGDELFIVARGKVEVRRKGIPLIQLPARSHFGELALTCDTPRSASIYAVDATDLVVLDREGLTELGEKRPDLANRVLLRLMAWVGTRLIEMTDRAVQAENELRG